MTAAFDQGYVEPESLAGYDPTQHRRVCGVTAQQIALAQRGISQWANKRRLKWYVADRLRGLSLETMTAAYHQAFGSWQAVCGLVFEQTFEQPLADFVVLTRRIDGASGVLAEHELPNGNDRPIRGWFDIDEQWVVSPTPGRSIDLVAVATHEFGHGIGLGHEETRRTTALLDPIYDPRIRVPQEWDIAQAQMRYGLPVEEPTPIPPPSLPPTPGPSAAPPELQVMITVPSMSAMYQGTLQRKG